MNRLVFFRTMCAVALLLIWQLVNSQVGIVTWEVNMANEEVSPEGVYLAGGADFGIPGTNPMSDDDGDGIWTITMAMPLGYSGAYTFTNGACGDWSCKENIVGQECAYGQYSDRFLPEVTSAGATISTCFSQCSTDGTCATLNASDVTFRVDMSEQMVTNGVFLHAAFDGWGAIPMTDDDGDQIFEYTTNLEDGVYQYLFQNGEGGNEQFDSTYVECTLTSGAFTNRLLEVSGGQPIVMDPYCFNSCFACEGGGGTCEVNASIPDYVPTNELVGWYSLNGNAMDLSANGLHGTFSGPSLTEDRFGALGAAHFDGIDDYIAIPHNELLNFENNTVTSAMWLRIQDYPLGDNAYQVLMKVAGWGSNTVGYQAVIQANGNTILRAKNGNSSGWYQTIAAIDWEFDTYTHLVQVLTDSVCSTYINGELISSTIPSHSIIGTNQEPLILGWNNQLTNLGVSVAFNGDMDDVGFWNRALTEEEILALYNAELPMSCANESTVTFDGYTYDLVAIGDQCWFAENLRTEHYANGDVIPGELSNSEWQNTTEGAQAIYSNDASNLADYGRLYNWYAVDDARGLCPSGWHVPTDGEYMTLEMTLGMSESQANSVGWRGTDQGTQMKSSPSDNPAWNGTNTSGFSALAGGFRTNNGNFLNEGNYGYFWSSSPNGTGAWHRTLDSGYTGVYRYNDSLRSGFSVRCVRDESAEDDGSCISNDLGCTEPLACNFNPSASADDGSCEYASCGVGQPITFELDMNGQTISGDGIHIAGNFQGWDPAETEMTDDDLDGIYEVTLYLPVDSTYEFKFINGTSWDFVEEVPLLCQDEVAGNDNRYIHVPVETTGEIYSVCWESCAACGITSVRFRVDMTNGPGGISQNGMHVAGNFQGWDPGATALSDSDGDGVWETIESFATTEIPEGLLLFKFINGNSWSDAHESMTGQWCSDEFGNRMLELTSENVILGADDDLSLAPCFDYCGTCVQPRMVTFRVDMTTQATVSLNGVHVAGSFQGWNPSANALSDADGDGIWETTMLIQPGDYQFKFINGNDWSGNGNGNVDNETIVGDCAAEGSDTRALAVGAEDILYEVCYNACELQCLGCSDPLACNYNPNTISLAELCEYPGCLDASATNYNPASGCDGPCIYFTYDCASLGELAWGDELMGLFPDWQEAMHGVPWEGEWVFNVPLSLVEPISGISHNIHHVNWTSFEGLPIWLDEADYSLGELDASSQRCITASGTPTAPGIYEIVASGEVFITILGEPFSIGEQSYSGWLEVVENPNPIPGCTYPLASNFLNVATIEDGSCVFIGCSDPSAANFNPFANSDDGSCGEEVCDTGIESMCESDFDNDGTVSVSDLLMLLSEFGTGCDE